MHTVSMVYQPGASAAWSMAAQHSTAELQPSWHHNLGVAAPGILVAPGGCQAARLEEQRQLRLRLL